MKSAMRSLFVIAIVYFCYSQLLIAQWSTDPTVNNAICTMPNTQSSPAIASDDSGGAIIVWKDYRGGGQTDLYAQRISAGGTVKWTTDGVAICTATGFQGDQVIISDGSGGAIIAWDDYRSGSFVIYAQRINADSTVRWTKDGVPLCNSTGNLSFPTLTSDGSGGAIVVWEDNRVGRSDIYAQRISADGTVQWPLDGVPLCAISGVQSSPTAVISDGKGGAIVAWEDARNLSDIDIYAQRIDSNGIVQWPTDGVAICTAIYNQTHLSMVSDDSGGVFVAWQDWRSANFDIYAQRINADSTVHWTANGVAICTATDNQSTPNITRDGSGGAIITWHDNRSGNLDIYAQRINADGSMRWTPDGAAVCTVAGGQAYPMVVSDGSGGAVIMWWDYRDGVNDNIFAQRMNDGGTIQWSADGVAICTATGYQGPPFIVSDSSGGSIATWEDQRNVSDENIYAQRVYSTGNLYTSVKDIRGIIPNEFKLSQNYPNPFNPSTRIDYNVAKISYVRLVVYDMLGREVAILVNGQKEPGSYTVEFNGAALSSGIYFFKMTTDQFSSVHKMTLTR